MSIDELITIKDKYEALLFSKTTVHGVGVGRKLIGGEPTGRICIVVTVSNKLPLSELSVDDLIPATLDGVEVDVREEEKAVFSANDNSRYRPVMGGIRIENTPHNKSGTLGAVVYKDGKTFALSVTHVLYPHYNGATIGDAIGQYQDEQVGVLSEGLAFVSPGNNSFDASIAELYVTNISQYQQELGATTGVPKTVSVNDTVLKSGMNTGLTSGKVDAVSYSMTMVVPTNSGDLSVYFTNQIKVVNVDTAFSGAGDSGALVVDANENPVGLLFANTSTSNAVSPIGPILDHYGVSFIKPTTIAVELTKVQKVPSLSVDKISVVVATTLSVDHVSLTPVQQDYTLTADTGSFKLTGQPVGFKRILVLSTTTGVFTLTGNPATITRQYVLTASPASFTLSGQPVDFYRHRTLPATTGAFSLTGQPATLTRARVMPAGTGVFTLSGTAVGFRRAYFLPATTGVFTLTGNPASFILGLTLRANPGTFTLSSAPATFSRTYRLATETATYTLNTLDASLVTSRLISPQAGVFSLTGGDVGFTQGYYLAVGTGELELTGLPASLTYTALSAPTVVTIPATLIETDKAVLRGDITDAGNATITERGFELSLTPFS